MTAALRAIEFDRAKELRGDALLTRNLISSKGMISTVTYPLSLLLPLLLLPTPIPKTTAQEIGGIFGASPPPCRTLDSFSMSCASR